MNAVILSSIKQTIDSLPTKKLSEAPGTIHSLSFMEDMTEQEKKQVIKTLIDNQK